MGELGGMADEQKETERVTVSQEWLDRLTATLREMEVRRNRLRAEAAELDRLIAQQVGAVGLMQELVGGDGAGKE